LCRLEPDVSGGEVAIGDRLMQLGLVVAVVDPREEIAVADVLPLLDRLLDDLSENLGADNDVFVLSDDVAGTGQEDSTLAA
jgi:hypothetical protein